MIVTFESARRKPDRASLAEISYCRYALKECRKALRGSDPEELERARQIIKCVKTVIDNAR